MTKVAGMKRTLPLFLLLLGTAAYAFLIFPFTEAMGRRSVEEKLGYVPSTKLLRPLSADQKELVAASLVFRTMMYFGGIVGRGDDQRVVPQPVDLPGMSRTLHAAVRLDPYNMDAYYFAQAFLTWDARQYKVANELLDYGMKYRSWDWYLPFFAGFNSAYFLKDYARAADYYRRAADLSGQDLLRSLAGRYMQESGQTRMAIAYLSSLEKGERNPAMRRNYQYRIRAFREVLKIEDARDRFRSERGRLPASVEELVATGYLPALPVDPYGGRFVIEESGKVTSTSKFAFAGQGKSEE